MLTAVDALATLVDRYDPSTFELPRSGRLLSLASDSDRTLVAVSPWGAEIVPPSGRRCDATLTATGATWSRIASDVRGGLEAFAGGELRIRGDLNAAIGFLAATTGTRDPSRLRIRRLETRAGEMSIFEAGSGEPLVLLHGLGASKASFLPTVAALAGRHHVVAVDLPGFGDSVKPIAAGYDAPYFARSIVAVAEALRFDRMHVLGHSLGGRVALEVGLRNPERVASLSLLMPSLPWLRERSWAPLLRLVRPELGLLQVAPRPVVETIVRRMVPGASRGWMAAGVDEFLRSFCDPRGRAAFYAAARNIYLEPARSPDALWQRLSKLDVPALFVWGRDDTLVPLGFAPHVERVMPEARHVILDCGHVPQFECPDQVHDAVRRFLSANAMSRRGNRVISLRGQSAAQRVMQRRAVGATAERPAAS
jgi:pimeloyl-ACP methyl ester carboxylesterase